MGRWIRHAAVAAAALLLALAAGCSSSAPKPAPAGSAGTTAGSAVASPPSASPSDNGVAQLDAATIFVRARTASEAAQAVHLAGQVPSGNQTLGLDLHISGSQGATGSITSGGKQIQITRIGTTVYLSADRAFWTSTVGQAGANLLTGKWLQTTTSDPNFKDLGTLTDIHQLFSQLLSTPSVTKGATTQVNGTEAIALNSTDQANPATVYVATQGPAYLLRLTKQGTSPGSIDFTDYNQPVTLQAPPADQTVNVSQLGTTAATHTP